MLNKIAIIIIFLIFSNVNAAENNKVVITQAGQEIYNDYNNVSGEKSNESNPNQDNSKAKSGWSTGNILTNLSPKAPQSQDPSSEQNDNKDNRSNLSKSKPNVLDNEDYEKKKSEKQKTEELPKVQVPTPVMVSKMGDQDEALSRAQMELKQRLTELKGIKLTPEQIAAADLPAPVTTRPFDIRSQIRPPNISKRLYNKDNAHLKPEELLSDKVLAIFDMLQSKDYSYTTIQNIKALIDDIDNPIIVDKYGNSFLMHAILMKKYKVMMYLINSGLSINLKNNFGTAPIHLATHNGDHIATVAILEAGGDVNLPDGNYNTPLMYAAMSGNVSLAKRIIDYGGDIDSFNSQGLSVMDFAVYSENLNMVNYLASRGYTLLAFKGAMRYSNTRADYIDSEVAQHLISEYKKRLSKAEYFYYAR